jgi:hypothetical protein
MEKNLPCKNIVIFKLEKEGEKKEETLASRYESVGDGLG